MVLFNKYGIQKTRILLLVSSVACELKVTILNKTPNKLKNQQLFLDLTERWGHRGITAPKTKDTNKKMQNIATCQSINPKG